MNVHAVCSDAKIPLSSASIQDRSVRADIAASFQVSISLYGLILSYYFNWSVWNLLQHVAVLHLEERCERAIDWALKIEPSIRHLVKTSYIPSFRMSSSYIYIFLPVSCTHCWSEDFSCVLPMQVVSGGVASNKYVRAQLTAVVRKKGLQLVCPPPSLCTDNGIISLLNLMIKCGYIRVY